MEILEANINNLPDILDLQKLAFHENAIRYSDFAIPPLMQTLDELVKESKTHIILKAVIDNKIIGSARGCMKEDRVYIGRLIVHPDYQNQGIGCKLIIAIEKKFDVLKFELTTGHLDDKNIALYTKLGYKISEREKISDSLYFIHMKKTIHIRHAERDDLYNIAVFLHDSWQSEYRQIVADEYLDSMSAEERHTNLIKRYDENTSAFLMMLDDDRLIGAAVFGKSFTDGYEDDGEISAIYLHKDYIGKGYGHRLFVKTEQELTAKGYTHFALDLLTENERALGFYIAHGYQKVADRSIKLGERDYPLAVLRKRVPRTSIRKWRREDAPDLVEAINNKNVLDNLRDGIPFPCTEKDAEDFIRAMLDADKNTTYAFAIIHDNKVIGSIGVFRKDNVHRLTAELGYYIGEPYWGKGITAEAVRLICDYVFENTDIVRIFAEPFASDTASCKVLEKAGFQFEGTLQQNAVKNGKLIDMKMYALLKDGGEAV